MLLFFPICLLLVLLKYLGLSLTEPTSFLLLLLLKRLVPSCIFKHLLRVFIALLFEFVMVFFGFLLELLFKLIFDLGLICLELLNLAANHQFLAGYLLFELLNFILQIIRTGFLIDACMAGIPRTRQVIHQPVPFRIDFVHFALLGEDFVAVEEVGVADDAGGGAGRDQAPCRHGMGHEAVLLQLAAAIFHLVDHQAAVAPRRKQPIIVVTEAHSLDGAGVGLDLADVLHGEAPDLHRSRIASLARTCQERLPIGHHLQLRYIVPGLTVVGMVCRVPDFPLIARHDRSSNLTWHIDAAFELSISWLEIVLFAPSALKSLLLQVVEGDLTLVAAICET